MKASAYKIAEGVYWVGTLDWDLRSYHGYTLDGTTYNAYLLFGEKTVLIDNVYPGQAAQMWGRIADACSREGRDLHIDIIVQNHVEKDHSGALAEIHKNSLMHPSTALKLQKRTCKTLPNRTGSRVQAYQNRRYP